MHRYQYSLDLLRQVIDKAPRFFPAGRRKDMEETYAAFRRDPKAARQTVDDAMIAFGKEIWPYRKAFWHIHDTDGRHDENAYLLETLLPELRAKFEAFLKKGFRIEDVRQGGEFERYFTPEEKHALIEAKLVAHDKVVAGIEELCAGEHKQTCENALVRYTEEQKRIEALLGELRKHADRSAKWRPEILDKVRTFEAGWSGLEKEVTADDVKGEIDYYGGVIEVFE